MKRHVKRKVARRDRVNIVFDQLDTIAHGGCSIRSSLCTLHHMTAFERIPKYILIYIYICNQGARIKEGRALTYTLQLSLLMRQLCCHRIVRKGYPPRVLHSPGRSAR